MIKECGGIDTSGNTGKSLGITGIAIVADKIIKLRPYLTYIKAYEGQTEQEYFDRILLQLQVGYVNTGYQQSQDGIERKIIVQVEKYIEYQNKATKFSSSPTVKLNSLIENGCKDKSNVIFREKTASHIKSRGNDKVLELEGFGELEEFKKRNTKPYKDMIDALRHALDGYYFEEIKNVSNN